MVESIELFKNGMNGETVYRLIKHNLNDHGRLLIVFIFIFSQHFSISRAY